MKRTVIAVLVIATAISQAGAINTGGELLKECGYFLQARDDAELLPRENALEGTICAGYVAGIFQAHDRLRARVEYMQLVEVECTALIGSDGIPYSGLVDLPTLLGIDYCLSDKPVPDHMIRVVVQYLKDHPEDLQERSIILIERAFRDAFLCPEDKNEW